MLHFVLYYINIKYNMYNYGNNYIVDVNISERSQHIYINKRLNT